MQQKRTLKTRIHFIRPQSGCYVPHGYSSRNGGNELQIHKDGVFSFSISLSQTQRSLHQGSIFLANKHSQRSVGHLSILLLTHVFAVNHKSFNLGKVNQFHVIKKTSNVMSFCDIRKGKPRPVFGYDKLHMRDSAGWVNLQPIFGLPWSLDFKTLPKINLCLCKGLAFASVQQLWNTHLWLANEPQVIIKRWRNLLDYQFLGLPLK